MKSGFNYSLNYCFYFFNISGFSTRSEEAIERKVDVMLPDICSSENELIEKYDLDECVKWITDNNLEKVGGFKLFFHL